VRLLLLLLLLSQLLLLLLLRFVPFPAVGEFSANIRFVHANWSPSPLTTGIFPFI
jgi:hypothetical protein